MEIQLRSMSPDDVEGIIAVHKKSVYGLCKDFYSEEQMEIWTDMFRRRFSAEGMNDPDNIGIVAVNGDKIVGYGFFDLQDKEIKGVYLIPEIAKKGLGQKILSKLESMAGEHGLDELVLNSTLNAERFYEKCGYTRICDKLFELSETCKLSCVHMIKKLVR